MPASALKERPRDMTVGEPVGSGGVPSRLTLVAEVLGFFVVTLDAVVVNVALPSIRQAFGGGISGLQWVVDGYTLAFAGLLLGAGALSDRVGARRAFGAGVVVFVAASAACSMAPTLGALLAARFVQGSAAAVLMPASMALLSQAYPEGPRRAQAVALQISLLIAAGVALAAASAGRLLGSGQQQATGAPRLVVEGVAA